MQHIEAVLICDGPSDQALEHPIRWLLSKSGFQGTLNIEVPDFRKLKPRSSKLHHRLEAAVKLFQPSVIFIHRDAEREQWEARVSEIESSFQKLNRSGIPYVPIVPVRMLESWLLFDEEAIRRAAGNPNGRCRLTMPRISTLSGIPDPKGRLCSLLSTASELSGRKLRKFKPLSKRHLVAEEIGDFSPLLAVDSFKEVQNSISRLVASI